MVVAMATTLLLAPLVLYVGGYFGLATTERGTWILDNNVVVYRTYDVRWLALLFEPAGRLEERLMEYEVEIRSKGDGFRS